MAVHVGRQNAVDVMQADTVRGLATVVEHETFHHNVPMHLERDGALVPLLKRELLELMLRLRRSSIELSGGTSSPAIAAAQSV